jgi:Zn-dependent alcohol dehydrogenase
MKGIVFTGESAEVLTGLEVRDPGPGEVIVRIVAAGVCHSDVTAASGAFGWPAPAVLGHEGAGVVDQIGIGVTNVEVGDHVIISTLAACGMCKACAAGKPTRCRQTLGNMAQPFTLNGDPCWNFAAASVFTERTIVKAIQAVKIPKDVPLTSACLVGCGVMTGAGSVLYRSNVQVGDTAVVYGCGGVGLNAIQALRVRRASRIIAIDTEPQKEALARAFGATDYIDGRSEDVIEQVRKLVPYSDTELSGPFNAGGVDWVYDVVGHPTVTSNALEMLDWGGTVVIIGTPGGDAKFELPYQRFTQNERGVIGSRAGSYSPHRDIPQIIDLYRRGEFMLDELVSATYPMENFADVVHDMHSGSIARGVLTFD